MNKAEQKAKLEQARALMVEVKDAMQSDFDDLSEKAQEGAIGEAINANLDSLEEADEQLQQIFEAM